VPVEPGQTYLLAVWVKCQDVEGDVRVHAHRRQADGQLSAESPYASIGPSIGGTTDWTLLTGQLTMPHDTTVLQLHLTMEHPGTLWHDHVLIPVLAGDVLQVERWYVPHGSAGGLAGARRGQSLSRGRSRASRPCRHFTSRQPATRANRCNWPCAAPGTAG
jgi:hypothetical protein